MTGILTLLDQPRTLDVLARPTSAIISFFLAGTTIFANIYSDANLTTPAANPVVLSSGQVFPTIYLDPSISYRRRIDYGDGTIYDIDPFVVDILQKLAEPGGSAFVGFSHANTYAAGTAGAKFKNVVCVTDAPYNAAVNGSTDDTTAFNLATGAAITFSSSLFKAVNIGNGSTVLGASNSTVYVRKGQNLTGTGVGSTTVDLSSRVANTAPVFKLGEKSDGTDDPGGQPVQVSNMLLLGGPALFPVIDTNGCAGWKLNDLFYSGPGLGIKASGGDGLCHDNIFDLGVNHIVVAGGNLKFTNNLHYLGNYHITLDTGAYDTLINDCQFEYFQYVAIQFQTAATGLKNIQIRNCNFIQNEQFTTSEAAISMRGTGSDAVIQNSTFRNLYGAGVAISDGTTDAVIENCVFDGNKTLAGYAQSTTMKGVSISGARRVIIRNCEFRNLPGQPVELLGVDVTDLIMIGCTFGGNTGGTTEVNLTNINASKLTMIGCRGGGRPLVNASSTVQVKLIDCDDGVTGIPSVASATAMTLPKGKDFINITGTTAITSIPCNAGDNGRVVTLLFAGALTLTDGGNLKLAGNFVTAADGTVTLRCNGTNWYETGRSVN